MPENPLTWEELLTRNKKAVLACAVDPPDKQVDELLKEILKERSMGKMWGPFRAPKGWDFATVQLPAGWAESCDQTTPLWEIPDTITPLIAPAFGITQLDADGLS